MWRIYYSDGLFVEDSAPVAEVPSDRVQAILWYDEATSLWLIISKYDRYRWDYGRWFGCEAADVGPYLLRPGWKKVLFGEYLPNAEYEAVMRRVIADRKILNGKTNG